MRYSMGMPYLVRKLLKANKILSGHAICGMKVT